MPKWPQANLKGLWRVAGKLLYVPVLATAMATMMVRLLIIARLLSISEFGQYSGGLLVSGTFCMLGCLGFLSHLQRELPRLLIAGRSAPGLVLVMQCNLVACACSATLLVIALGGGIHGKLLLVPLCVGLVHGLTQQLFLVATVESRSSGDALGVSRQNLLRATITIGVSTFVAWGTRSAICVLGGEMAVSAAMAIGLIHRSLRREGLGASAVIGEAFRSLPMLPWGSAPVLLAVSTLGFLSINIDRWIAVSVLSVVAFANYSFSWILLTASQTLQALVNTAAFPWLVKRNATQGGAATFRACAKLSVSILLLGAILAVPAWFAVEFAVHRWFPMYVGALRIVPIFLGIAVLRTSDFWSSYLLIKGMEAQMVVLNVLAAAIGFGYWVVSSGGVRATGVEASTVAVLALFLSIAGYCGYAVLASSQGMRDAR